MQVDIKRTTYSYREGMFGFGKKVHRWAVITNVTLTNEERVALSAYGEDDILFTNIDECPGPFYGQEVTMPIHLFVNKETGRSFPNQAGADRFHERLKSEILPKLKALLRTKNLNDQETVEL